MWRQQLEDRYTVICKKCKKELIDINKKPNQKYFQAKCPYCNYTHDKSKLPVYFEAIVEAIPKSKGGGFMATCPALGKYAITGDGETVEEAIRNLATATEEQFKIYKNNGIIPRKNTIIMKGFTT